MEKTPLIIGCDHAAYHLKEILKACLLGWAIPVTDVGTHDQTAVDYPDIGAAVAGRISNRRFQRGILLCGTGIGMAMVANKFPHVRAALCNDLFCAIMARRHNDANVLVMGGRVVGEALALEILRAWLETPFEGGRHGRRLQKFDCLATLSQTP
jgi:ribose 5-phosphate isomerase B